MNDDDSLRTFDQQTMRFEAEGRAEPGHGRPHVAIAQHRHDAAALPRMGAWKLRCRLHGELRAFQR